MACSRSFLRKYSTDAKVVIAYGTSYFCLVFNLKEITLPLKSSGACFTENNEISWISKVETRNQVFLSIDIGKVSYRSCILALKHALHGKLIGKAPVKFINMKLY